MGGLCGLVRGMSCCLLPRDRVRVSASPGRRGRQAARREYEQLPPPRAVVVAISRLVGTSCTDDIHSPEVSYAWWKRVGWRRVPRYAACVERCHQKLQRAALPCELRVSRRLFS